MLDLSVLLLLFLLFFFYPISHDQFSIFGLYTRLKFTEWKSALLILPLLFSGLGLYITDNIGM